MIRLLVIVAVACAALVYLPDLLGSQVKATNAHRAAQIEAAGG